RAIAVIGLASGQHLLGDLSMAAGAGELEDGLAIPVEAEPAQAFENGLDRRFGGALPVGVLDAQAEGAAVMTGIEPVEQGRAGATDMQVASGRGGEAGNDGHDD